MNKDREKFREALADLDHPEATVWTHWALEAYDMVHWPELRNKEKEMPVKRIMTRTEVSQLVQNIVFGLTDTEQAAKWIKFFVAAGMLEVKEEETTVQDVLDSLGLMTNTNILIAKLNQAGYRIIKHNT